MDGWISSKIKNGVALSPENRKDVGCLACNGRYVGLKLMLVYSPFILYMYTTSRPQHQTLKLYMYYVNSLVRLTTNLTES